MLPRASGLVVALGALVAHAQAQSGFMVIPDSPDRTAMQSECGPSDRQAAVLEGAAFFPHLEDTLKWVQGK